MLGRLYLITDRHAVAGPAPGAAPAMGPGTGAGAARALADAARALADAVQAALSALPPGAALVQLREKDLDTRSLLALAHDLRAITAARSCPLLINDRVDIALAAAADGVHLPETGLNIATARALLGPERLIGASTHDPAAAAHAARAGADLIVLGPVWATPSKAAYGPPLGPDALTTAARFIDEIAGQIAGQAIGQLAGQPTAGHQPPGGPPRRPHLFALGGVDTPERAHQARLAGAHGIAAIRAFLAAPAPAAAARAFHRAITPSDQPSTDR